MIGQTKGLVVNVFVEITLPDSIEEVRALWLQAWNGTTADLR
jgi:hypothetical protein